VTSVSIIYRSVFVALCSYVSLHSCGDACGSRRISIPHKSVHSSYASLAWNCNEGCGARFISAVHGLLSFLASIRIPFLSVLPCPYRYFGSGGTQHSVHTVTPSNALSSPPQVERTRNTSGRPGTRKDSIRLFYDSNFYVFPRILRLFPCHIPLISANSRSNH
jgi:hypothetical protein